MPKRKPNSRSNGKGNGKAATDLPAGMWKSVGRRATDTDSTSTTKHKAQKAEAERAPGEDLFNAAVAELKEIRAREDKDWRHIGERVAEVGKAYGEDPGWRPGESDGLRRLHAAALPTSRRAMSGD